jgi:hypothetical protein
MPQKKKKERSQPSLERVATRKSRKQEFVPTLFIHGVAYEFGTGTNAMPACFTGIAVTRCVFADCGFCAASKAVIHCKDCPEFLCGACEQRIHAHKKHQRHRRDRLCKYDLEGASNAIKGFFRYLKAREVLRGLCRQVRHTHPPGSSDVGTS